MAVYFRLIILVIFSFIAGCDSSSGDSSGGGQNPESRRRINWNSIPEKFHPEIDTVNFSIDSYQRLKINIFGFTDDVEVVYSPQLQSGEGYLKVYKVWYKSASWGNLSLSKSAGNSLSIFGSGNYQCSIQTSNKNIVGLEGGCYVRLQLILPSGSELEVYNVGQLITRQFYPMDNGSILSDTKDATTDDARMAVIRSYLSSYKATKKTPTLNAEQLGQVIREFNWTDNKFAALEILHIYVTDRENLSSMIDSEFNYFDREKARQIVKIGQ